MYSPSPDLTYSSSDHAIVRKALVKIGLKKAADRLKALRDRRNYADYDLNRSITEREASDAIMFAEEIVTKIGGFRP